MSTSVIPKYKSDELVWSAKTSERVHEIVKENTIRWEIGRKLRSVLTFSLSFVKRRRIRITTNNNGSKIGPALKYNNTARRRCCRRGTF